MSESYRVKRLLVPVDGSEFSRFAAQYALRLAAAQRSEVIFLHVVDRKVVKALTRRGTVSESAALQELTENGRVYLHDVARLAGELRVDHREELSEGDPAVAIIENAARMDVDLIVMGRRGRSGPRRMLMGSITQRVIECGDRPILVITGPPAAEGESGRQESPEALPS
ncbi:universal stress protein [Candidatus Binatia bacterium]|nr:universal stress protein [Candidatus Binatia bacterium]